MLPDQIVLSRKTVVALELAMYSLETYLATKAARELGRELDVRLPDEPQEPVEQQEPDEPELTLTPGGDGWFAMWGVRGPAGRVYGTGITRGDALRALAQKLDPVAPKAPKTFRGALPEFTATLADGVEADVLADPKTYEFALRARLKGQWLKGRWCDGVWLRVQPGGERQRLVTIGGDAFTLTVSPPLPGHARPRITIEEV